MMNKFLGAIAAAVLVALAGSVLGFSSPIFLILIEIIVIGWAFFVYPTFFYLLGVTKYGNKQYDKALGWLERAVASNRLKLQYRLSCGYYLLRLGKWEQAEKIFEGIVEKSGKDNALRNQALSNLSILYAKTDRFDKALALIKKIFAVFKSSNTYGIYGYFLILTGDIDAALALNEEAYDYNDENKVIMDNLGLCYTKCGRLNDAEKIFDKLIESSPTFIEAYYDAAQAKIALGKNDEAIDLLETAKNTPCNFLSWVSHDMVCELMEGIEDDRKKDKA